MDTSAEKSPNPAPLWRRLAALIYDLFPLIGLWMLTVFLALFAAGRNYDPAHPQFLFRLWLQLALLAVTAAYFVISWASIGATIGMRAWKLALIREDGAKPGFVQALARFLVALPSLLVLGIGFWWVLFDADDRALHDRVCKTAMIRR